MSYDRLRSLGNLASFALPGMVLLLCACRQGDSPAVPVARRPSEKMTTVDRADCRIETTRVERDADGSVKMVSMRVSSTVRHANIVVESYNLTVLSPIWTICIASTSDGREGGVDRQLIADAIMLSMESVAREYPPGPVCSIYFDPENMPREFGEAFYQLVATKMRQLDSKPNHFCDARLRGIVVEGYRRMEYIEYIRSRLEHDGYAVRIDTGEHCCLDAPVEMDWRDIADLPAAGLRPRTVVCALSIEKLVPGNPATIASEEKDGGLTKGDSNKGTSLNN